MLSPFEMLIVALMRLRLNMPVQHVACLFQVHTITIGNDFVETVIVIYKRLVQVVHLPDWVRLQTSMHHYCYYYYYYYYYIFQCARSQLRELSNWRFPPWPKHITWII